MSKSNVKVTFGSMTIGAAGQEQSRVHDLELAQSILDVLHRHGVNEIDTARMYGGGTCEEYLGKLKVQDQGFLIQTKVFPSARAPFDIGGPYKYTLSREDVLKSLDKSLAALQVQSIDLFYLHAPDRLTPLEETLGAVNEAYQQKKFARFGISNFTAAEVEQICEIAEKNGWVKPTVYQGVYNAVLRSAEPELVPVLRKQNIAFYIFNPLAGGFATGRYENKDAKDEDGSRFDPNRVQGKMYRARYWNDAYFNALEHLKPVVQQHGLTLPETMLRWLEHHSVLKQQYGDSIIIGASSLNHIEQNLLDLEKGPLPEGVVKALDEAWGLIQPNAPKYHH